MEVRSTQQFEVMSPWAEADPIPLKGLTPRLTDLSGKKIGLLANNKRAAPPILNIVERELKRRYPTLEFTRLRANTFSVAYFEKDRLDEFKNWLNGVDAVVSAVGD